MSSSPTTPDSLYSQFIDPDVIPAHHPARTLVLCFDGTGDSFDDDNSNVVQFFQMLNKGNRNEQMVYYQAGIGTYETPEIATPMVAKISKTLDEMIAWNLHAHVMQGYEFLMQNYEAGDKICLFGFSRGAYTARALAGMVHKVGLLPACNHQQVPFAYKMFTRTDEKGWRQSTAFKKAFSMDVDIDFIGVWDTVNSVGLFPRRLPFTSSNASIKTFRHALALDEHRAKFKANTYNRPTEKEKELGTQKGDMPKTCKPQKRKKTQDALESEFTGQDAHHQDATDVLEVWFAGCHTDVGGGSVSNDSRNNLARIPLRWMIRQCFLSNTGIRFHKSLLKAVGMDPDTLWPHVKPRTPTQELNLNGVIPTPTATPVASLKSPSVPAAKAPASNAHVRASTSGTVDTLVDHTENKLVSSPVRNDIPITIPLPAGSPPRHEDEEDHIDAHCAIYDQLKIKWFWWILELVPITQRVQKEDDTWKKYLTINLGRPRVIPKQGGHKIKIHRSVKIRMEAEAELLEGAGKGKGKKYAPKAKWAVDPEWVD